MKLPTGAVVAVAILLQLWPEGRLGAQSSAREFLAAEFQLTSRELQDLDRGRAVSRTLEVSDNREVAVLGAIRIAAPANFYVDQMRDIVNFKKSDAVLQIGRFSRPARVDDLAGLSLEPRDVSSLQHCRPGDCDIKLSVEAIERFERELPDRGNAADTATRIMREVLVELVEGYRRSGDAALMTYAGTERPLSIAEEFRKMVASPPAVLERFPVLHRHVLEFPRATAAAAAPEGSTLGPVEDVIYWSKEKMGPAVLVSVTHLAIAPIARGQTAGFVIASKQIYGSRYFDTSLGLTVLVQDAGSDATYLVYLNRSRLDALGGIFGGLKRAVVRSRSRSTMGTSLVQARDLVEQRFKARGGSRTAIQPHTQPTPAPASASSG